MTEDKAKETEAETKAPRQVKVTDTLEGELATGKARKAGMLECPNLTYLELELSVSEDTLVHILKNNRKLRFLSAHSSAYKYVHIASLAPNLEVLNLCALLRVVSIRIDAGTCPHLRSLLAAECPNLETVNVANDSLIYAVRIEQHIQDIHSASHTPHHTHTPHTPHSLTHILHVPTRTQHATS